jgi:hypothetical protein
MVQLANRAAPIVTSSSLVRVSTVAGSGIRFVGGDRAHGCAHLSHEGGGVHVVPLGVADLQGDGTVGHDEGVVPVSANIEPVAAWSVSGGDLQAGEVLGQRGEHGLLERRGQLDSCLLQANAFQCLACKIGKSTHEGALIRGRVVFAVVGHQPGPERLIADRAEGGDRDGEAGVELVEVRHHGPVRPAADVVLLVGNELRLASADHIGQRAGGVQRQALQGGHRYRDPGIGGNA